MLRTGNLKLAAATLLLDWMIGKAALLISLWLLGSDLAQLVSLAAYAAYAVHAGARERCRLCGRPIDPVDGHVCPATNGHGPLTV